MNESKDKDKLPVLTQAERAKYVDFWQAFKCKRPLQEMTADMPTSYKASMQIDSHKKTHGLYMFLRHEAAPKPNVNHCDTVHGVISQHGIYLFC